MGQNVKIKNAVCGYVKPTYWFYLLRRNGTV